VNVARGGPPDRPRLSVVIVNYGSSALVGPLVRSLPSWTDVIVVDNWSSSNEVALLRRSIDKAKLILIPRNLGFASGVNAGILEAGADAWVLLLNPDATISQDDLEILWTTARMAGLDISSPLILAPDGGHVWYGGGTINLLTASVTHVGIAKPPTRTTQWAATEFVSGCVMLLSPRARERVLPFREDLFMYWEDVELCLQAKSADLCLGIVYSAVGYHAQGGTLREGKGKSTLYYRYTARNRLIVAKRRPEVNTVGSLAWTPWLTIRRLLRIVVEEDRRWVRSRALLRGTAEGIAFVLSGSSKGLE
jgi:N-acetylglucosaminyl-diphospho-decaprenol L-rhamnosyltransferase